MVSNKATYKNLTPAQPLDQKTLNRMVWRSCNLQGAFNYERMQSIGWLYAILPGLEKIHTDEEDLSLSMQHNLEFFNTHPFLATFVMGIVLSMEQQKTDINTIRVVRTAAMSSLGGIGDAIFWFTLVPIVASICSNVSVNGSLAGPILFLVVFNFVQFVVRFFLMNWSYKYGTIVLSGIAANTKEFVHAVSVLGVFVVGALTANYGGTTVSLTIENGESPILVQNILDGVFPKIIPLALTMVLFFFMKKKGWSSFRCTLMLVFLGIAGALIGIF